MKNQDVTLQDILDAVADEKAGLEPAAPRLRELAKRAPAPVLPIIDAFIDESEGLEPAAPRLRALAGLPRE